MRDRSTRPMRVAPGVFRLGSDRINWYVLTSGEEVLVVDAGAPAHWSQLEEAVAPLGSSLEDITGVVLTHGHVDHVGCAERLRREFGVPIYVHRRDAPTVQSTHGPPWHLVRRSYRPAVAALLLEGMRSGLANPAPVEDVVTVEDGDRLPLPGRPEIVHLPGHTPGHIGLWIPGRELFFAGDALVTLNLLTGRSCQPRPLPEPFSDDYGRACRSLEPLRDLEVRQLLPGHGDPWFGELTEVIDRHAASEG